MAGLAHDINHSTESKLLQRASTTSTSSRRPSCWGGLSRSNRSWRACMQRSSSTYLLRTPTLTSSRTSQKLYKHAQNSHRPSRISSNASSLRRSLLPIWVDITNWLLASSNESKPLNTQITPSSTSSAALAQTHSRIERYRFTLRKYLLNVLVHACDIANPCLEWDGYMKWCYMLSQEFQDQTLKEEALGVEVT
jgi:hypothetical protein